MTQQREQSTGIVRKQRKPFVMSPTHLLCDSQLSSIAYKLWGIIESKPDGWKFYWSEILKHFKEGRDAVKKAGKELESFGYIQKIKAKKGNLLCGMDIVVFYDPSLPFDQENKGSARVTENQSPENQSPENQSSKIQESEIQDTYKELSKQDLSKKDLSNISFAKKIKKEKFQIPTLEEIKEIFENKSLRSDAEKYFLHRQKSNWSGIKNLDGDISWWENGHKEKFPHLHKEEKNEGVISKKSVKDIKDEEEIDQIRSSLKFMINSHSDDGYLIYHKLFSNKLIEKTSNGFVIYTSENGVSKFKELLATIKLTIETEL